MSTLTCQPQNILKSNKITKKEEARRQAFQKQQLLTKQKAEQEAKQKEAEQQAEQEQIQKSLKAFFEYQKGGSYRFLPGTDLKKGIIHFVSNYEDGNASDDSLYGDGESEADDW